MTHQDEPNMVLCSIIIKRPMSGEGGFPCKKYMRVCCWLCGSLSLLQSRPIHGLGSE
jgi:hypothetical protein